MLLQSCQHLTPSLQAHVSRETKVLRQGPFEVDQPDGVRDECVRLLLRVVPGWPRSAIHQRGHRGQGDRAGAAEAARHRASRASWAAAARRAPTRQPVLQGGCVAGPTACQCKFQAPVLCMFMKLI